MVYFQILICHLSCPAFPDPYLFYLGFDPYFSLCPCYPCYPYYPYYLFYPYYFAFISFAVKVIFFNCAAVGLLLPFCIDADAALMFAIRSCC